MSSSADFKTLVLLSLKPIVTTPASRQPNGIYIVALLAKKPFTPDINSLDPIYTFANIFKGHIPPKIPSQTNCSRDPIFAILLV